MKQFVVAVLLFASIPFGLFAQIDFYYSSEAPDGEKEYFSIRKERVIIKTKSETGAKTLSKQSVFRLAENFDSNMVIAEIDTLKTTLNNLRQMPDIADAAYALEYADGTLHMPTDEIFVKFNEGYSPERVLESVGLGKSIEAIELFNPNHNIYLITLNVKLGEILQVCRTLFESGLCEFAEPSFITKVKPCNLYYSHWQWGLNNTGQDNGTAGVDIRAELAWGITRGAGIKVAVIDTGVDLTHPDLQDNLLPGYDATGDGTNGEAIEIYLYKINNKKPQL